MKEQWKKQRNQKCSNKKTRTLCRNVLDLYCLWIDKDSNDNIFHDFKCKEIIS